MKKMIVLVLVLIMTGCGTQVEYRDKNVPVYMVPSPPSISRPDLPIHDIDINVTDVANQNNAAELIGKLVQAYVISIRLLLNYSTALDQIVGTYRRMSERDFSVDPIAFSNATSRRLAEDTVPRAFGTSTPSETADSAIEASPSDYGTLKVFADQQFNDIINKYEEEKENILNETETNKTD